MSKYKTITTTELGFTFPCESSKVTRARMEKYNINHNELYSACTKIIHYQGKDCAYYIDVIERFIASEISLYDKTFLGISKTDSTCAVAVPLESLFKKAKELIHENTLRNPIK